MQTVKETESADHQLMRFAQFRVGRPVAAVPSNTTFVDAGSVTIGLEHRALNEEILTGAYGPQRAKEIMKEQYGLEALENGTSDEGLSIHVFDAVTRTEHLRFDDLDANKHYHYMTSDGHHAVVEFDYVANGPFLPWVFKSLRANARAMLSLAGAESAAAALDEATLIDALAAVERLVSERSSQLKRSTLGGELGERGASDQEGSVR